mgnify:CR=1 FL=1
MDFVSRQLNSARFLDTARCVYLVYRMTSTSVNGLFGRVGEFNPERETFNAYTERMEMFFTANNIIESTGEGSIQANQVVANRKRAIFLTEVGPEVYSTLSNLLAPAKPKDRHLQTLSRSWRNIIIQNRSKLPRVSILVLEIRNPVNQLAIMYLL